MEHEGEFSQLNKPLLLNLWESLTLLLVILFTSYLVTRKLRNWLMTHRQKN